MEYLEGPLAASVKFKMASEILFPDITICPDYGIGYKECQSIQHHKAVKFKQFLFL